MTVTSMMWSIESPWEFITQCPAQDGQFRRGCVHAGRVCQATALKVRYQGQWIDSDSDKLRTSTFQQPLRSCPPSVTLLDVVFLRVWQGHRTVRRPRGVDCPAEPKRRHLWQFGSSPDSPSTLQQNAIQTSRSPSGLSGTLLRWGCHSSRQSALGWPASGPWYAQENMICRLGRQPRSSSISLALGIHYYRAGKPTSPEINNTGIEKE